jgi:AcrR family transcriptional regulator
MILPPQKDQRNARREELATARRSITRAAVVKAGALLFAQRGYSATGMAELAREAGVSLKAMYGAFGSKDEIFSAVIDEVFSRNLLPALRKQSDSTGVLGFVSEVLAAMEADRDYFLLYARGSVDVPESLKRDGHDPFAPYIAALTARLQTRIEEAGRLRGIDPHTVATAIVASVIALARDAVTGERARPIPDIEADVRALFAPVLNEE